MDTLVPRQSGGNALAYVYDGRQCLGHVLSRGPRGFEAFDANERSLGVFPTVKRPQTRS